MREAIYLQRMGAKYTLVYLHVAGKPRQGEFLYCRVCDRHSLLLKHRAPALTLAPAPAVAPAVAPAAAPALAHVDSR